MKRLVSTFLCICLLISSLSAFPVIAAEEEGIGVSLVTDTQEYSRVSQSDDVYVMAESVEDNPPHTYEAWVKFPVGTSASSVLFGNSNDGDNDMALEITAAGAPNYYWYSHYGIKYSVTFSTVNLFTGEWVHLAVTHDVETGFVSCYVNGELAEKQGQYPDFGTEVFNMPLGILGDNDYQNHPIFQGRIKNATLYADVRTAEEVYSDYKKGADLKDPDLIADYAMTSDKEDQDIANKKAGGIGLLYSNNWLTEEEMEAKRAESDFERAYSFAVIGDMQYSSEFYPESLPITHQWIKDNAEEKNILYYINAGDITNRDTAYEWQNAKDAISILDGVVPYSLVRGNHDIKNHKASSNQTYHDNYCADIGYETTTIGASLKGYGLDQYFGTDDPNSNTDYIDQFINNGENGGLYEDTTLINSWTIIEAGTSKWLIMNIDYGPSDKVLKWAGEVIAAHPDCKAIINTHCYMISSGAYSLQDTDEKDLSGVLLPDGDTQRNTGYETWQKLVSQYENIEMIICGHVTNGRLAVNQKQGVNGNTVTEMLVCPQVYDNRFRGLGMVAMYYFNEDGTEMDVEFYSTVANRYYKGFNQFHLDLEAETEEVPDWTGYANVPAGTGTETDPYLIADAGNLLWMANNVASSAGKYYLQTNDIDMAGLNTKVIGTGTTAFAGTYNGNGYTIKNGYIHNTTAADGTTAYGYGLFGALNGAAVQNVTLEEITVIGRGANGMIAGISTNSTIENCLADDSNKLFSLVPAGVTAFTESIGGLVGVANDGTVIKNCVYAGDIAVIDGATDLTVGGLVGTANDTVTLTDSYSNADLTYAGTAAPDASAWGGVVGSGTVAATNTFALRNVDADGSTDETDATATAAEKALAVKEINAALNAAEILTDGDWTYTGGEEGVTLVSYTGTETEVTIPAAVADTKVVALDDALFYGNAAITAVTIPETVTSIGVGAFYGTSLTEVTVPKNVTDMDGAFANIPTLTKATVSEGVQAVSYNVFGNCTALTEVYIPDSAKTVEAYAFAGCSALTAADIAKCTAIEEKAFEAATAVTAIHVAGDVNGDDKTDLMDTVLLLRKISGNLTAAQDAGFNLRAANVYDADESENEVNTADLVQLLKVVNKTWENGKKVTLTRSAANPTLVG
ncbi:MAG: leucine-rich repeat protein [Clostridia bacterium]|nr:leucine-rich repeat protein [Clostridia bacterium]